MLDHLECQHHVEVLVIAQYRLGIAQPVLDGHVFGAGMQPCRGDIAGRGIDADDVRPGPRERLRQQPATAAQVEDAQARQRRARCEPEVLLDAAAQVVRAAVR